MSNIPREVSAVLGSDETILWWGTPKAMPTTPEGRGVATAMIVAGGSMSVVSLLGGLSETALDGWSSSAVLMPVGLITIVIGLSIRRKGRRAEARLENTVYCVTERRGISIEPDGVSEWPLERGSDIRIVPASFGRKSILFLFYPSASFDGRIDDPLLDGEGMAFLAPEDAKAAMVAIRGVTG